MNVYDKQLNEYLCYLYKILVYIYIYISQVITLKKKKIIKYNDKRETFKFDRKLENGRQKLYDEIA